MRLISGSVKCPGKLRPVVTLDSDCVLELAKGDLTSPHKIADET